MYQILFWYAGRWAEFDHLFIGGIIKQNKKFMNLKLILIELIGGMHNQIWRLKRKIFLKLVLIWFHRPSKYPSRENILLAFDFSLVMYRTYLLHLSNSEFLFYLCCFYFKFFYLVWLSFFLFIISASSGFLLAFSGDRILERHFSRCFWA